METQEKLKKEYNKKYYNKNKGKILQNLKEYYKKNRRKILERVKKYSKRYEVRQKIREYKKKRWRNLNLREGFKKYSVKAQEKYVKKNPEKRKAKSLSRQLPLKSSCEICNSQEDLARHHWRYDKPLLVNTLCEYCHTIQHLKN